MTHVLGELPRLNLRLQDKTLGAKNTRTCAGATVELLRGQLEISKPRSSRIKLLGSVIFASRDCAQGKYEERKAGREFRRLKTGSRTHLHNIDTEPLVEDGKPAENVPSERLLVSPAGSVLQIKLRKRY